MPANDRSRADPAFRDDGRHHGFLLSLERCEYAIGTVFDVIMNGASFAGPLWSGFDVHVRLI
jgi:hypothetical protein